MTTKLNLISVVISTWRRPMILAKVLLALKNQTFDKNNFEVIVVDSNSNDETDQVVENARTINNLNVKLINISTNSVSAKRNSGLKAANGKFIVFLDDDCVPDINHLSKFYINAETTIGKQQIWCGGVKFNQELISKSNYYRYRDSCHYSGEKPLAKQLDFKTIVTMNMLIEKSVALRDNVLFNEAFVGYGFEDSEYGFRVEKLGYRISPCNADIEHMELEGDINKFSIKLYCAGRDGMPKFIELASEAVNSIGVSALLEPIQQNDKLLLIIKKTVFHMLLDSFIPKIVRKFIWKTDKIKILYAKTAFRLVLAGAYREGVRSRAKSGTLSIEQANKRGWY